MQLYLRFEEAGKPEVTTALKVTLPKRWVEKGKKCDKVLAMFVDAFNGKHSPSGECVLKSDEVELWGDKSKRKIGREELIGEALKGEETAWVRRRGFEPSVEKEPSTSNKLTDYVPRLLATREDLESMRMKNQEFLCTRANEVLALFGLPSDEINEAEAVRRITDERTGVETLICKCPSRVIELTSVIESQLPGHEWPDALARAWSQLGTVMARKNLRIGPFLPVKRENGNCVGQAHGTYWVCTPHVKRVRLNASDPIELAKVLGKLHSVARKNDVAGVCLKAVAVKPRPWRDEVLPKTAALEEYQAPYEMTAFDLEQLFNPFEIPVCWNHGDWTKDAVSVAVKQKKRSKKTGRDLDDDKKEEESEEEVYVIESALTGKPRPRLVDLLQLFTDALPGASMHVRLMFLDAALPAYCEAAEWPFTREEERLVDKIWALDAKARGDEYFEDVWACRDEIRRIFSEVALVPSVFFTHFPEKKISNFEFDEADAYPSTDEEFDDVPDPLDILEERLPDGYDRFYWARENGYGKVGYDRCDRKLRLRAKSAKFVDFFEPKYHGSGEREPDDHTPMPPRPDLPMVLTSELWDGSGFEAPRPFAYGHKRPTTTWEVAALVMLLFRHRERQFNVWDYIVTRIDSVYIMKSIDGLRSTKHLDDALSQQGLSVEVDPCVWPQPLTRGQVACAASHRQAWRLFLDTCPFDDCVFMEDDTDLCHDFRIILAESLRRIDLALPDFHSKYDVLYLHVPVDDRRMDPSVSLIDDLLDACFVHTSLNCYLVSKRGAAKLLDLTTTIDRPLSRFVNELALQGHIHASVLRNLDLVCDRGTLPADVVTPLDHALAGKKFESTVDSQPPYVPPRVRKPLKDSRLISPTKPDGTLYPIDARRKEIADIKARKRYAYSKLPPPIPPKGTVVYIKQPSNKLADFIARDQDHAWLGGVVFQ